MKIVDACAPIILCCVSHKIEVIFQPTYKWRLSGRKRLENIRLKCYGFSPWKKCSWIEQSSWCVLMFKQHTHQGPSMRNGWKFYAKIELIAKQSVQEPSEHGNGRSLLKINKDEKKHHLFASRNENYSKPIHSLLFDGSRHITILSEACLGCQETGSKLGFSVGRLIWFTQDFGRASPVNLERRPSCCLCYRKGIKWTRQASFDP